jgi:hypothetical protein
LFRAGGARAAKTSAGDPGESTRALVRGGPEGKKELVDLLDGVRESTQSWRELLLDLKRRGLVIGPELAVADGALGFWQAIEQGVAEDARPALLGAQDGCMPQASSRLTAPGSTGAISSGKPSPTDDSAGKLTVKPAADLCCRLTHLRRTPMLYLSRRKRQRRPETSQWLSASIDS